MDTAGIGGFDGGLTTASNVDVHLGGDQVAGSIPQYPGWTGHIATAVAIRGRCKAHGQKEIRRTAMAKNRRDGYINICLPCWDYDAFRVGVDGVPTGGIIDSIAIHIITVRGAIGILHKVVWATNSVIGFVIKRPVAGVATGAAHGQVSIGSSAQEDREVVRERGGPRYAKCARRSTGPAEAGCEIRAHGVGEQSYCYIGSPSWWKNFIRHLAVSLLREQDHPQCDDMFDNKFHSF